MCSLFIYIYIYSYCHIYFTVTSSRKLISSCYYIKISQSIFLSNIMESVTSFGSSWNNSFPDLPY